jgi:hypothetical protein
VLNHIYCHFLTNTGEIHEKKHERARKERAEEKEIV